MQKHVAPREIRMLSVTGCLGYGFTEVAFRRALDIGVDFIASDAGSMDPGPYYLGAGEAFVSPQAERRKSFASMPISLHSEK